MTALNDVLKAEQQADEMIETANKEAEATVVSAREEQKNRLDSEKNSLEEAEAEATKTKQTEIDGLVNKVISSTESQVTAIEKQFSEKKEAVKTALLSKFQ